MNTMRISVWVATLLGEILVANAPAQSSPDANVPAAISAHAAAVDGPLDTGSLRAPRPMTAMPLFRREFTLKKRR